MTSFDDSAKADLLELIENWLQFIKESAFASRREDLYKKYLGHLRKHGEPHYKNSGH